MSRRIDSNHESEFYYAEIE